MDQIVEDKVNHALLMRALQKIRLFNNIDGVIADYYLTWSSEILTLLVSEEIALTVIF